MVAVMELGFDDWQQRAILLATLPAILLVKLKACQSECLYSEQLPLDLELERVSVLRTAVQ